MRIAGVCLMVAAALVSGCGGDDGGGTPTETKVFTSITVDQPPTIVIGIPQTLSAVAKDQNGATMSGMTTTYTSSDGSKATVTNAGVVSGVAAGTSRITVTGTIGSVTKTAFVDVTVGAAPSNASVSATASSTFTPRDVVIARNGSVSWTFAALHNVTFGGGTAPTNIPDTATGSVSRTFATAGTYAYNCTLHSGMSGSVIVVP